MGEQFPITPGSAGYNAMMDVRSDPAIDSGATAGVQGIYVYDGQTNSAKRWFAGIASTTCTRATANTSLVTLSASNGDRRQWWAYNNADTDMFIHAGPSAGANIWSVKLAPNDYWELPADNGVYSGVLTAIWTSGFTAGLMAQITEATA